MQQSWGEKGEQGEITEAVSWKSARTFQVIFAFIACPLLCYCLLLSILQTLTENKCHKIITQAQGEIEKEAKIEGDTDAVGSSYCRK